MSGSFDNIRFVASPIISKFRSIARFKIMLFLKSENIFLCPLKKLST
jgi:hypothetical protein